MKDSLSWTEPSAYPQCPADTSGVLFLRCGRHTMACRGLRQP